MKTGNLPITVAYFFKLRVNCVPCGPVRKSSSGLDNGLCHTDVMLLSEQWWSSILVNIYAQIDSDKLNGILRFVEWILRTYVYFIYGVTNTNIEVCGDPCTIPGNINPNTQWPDRCGLLDPFLTKACGRDSLEDPLRPPFHITYSDRLSTDFKKAHSPMAEVLVDDSCMAEGFPNISNCQRGSGDLITPRILAINSAGHPEGH